MATGSQAPFLESRPCCASLPLPHAQTRPSAVRAIVWSSPALAATTGMSPNASRPNRLGSSSHFGMSPCPVPGAAAGQR